MATTIKSRLGSAREIVLWLEWELKTLSETLEDFHAYGQRFGQLGEDVYLRVLEDALKFRGMTLDQLRGVETPAVDWICDACRMVVITNSIGIPAVPCSHCGAHWWLRHTNAL